MTTKVVEASGERSPEGASPAFPPGASAPSGASLVASQAAIERALFADAMRYGVSSAFDGYTLAFSELYAAAPDLYEALAEFEHDGRLQTFEDRERFRKKARAALAKASPR